MVITVNIVGTDDYLLDISFMVSDHGKTAG